VLARRRQREMYLRSAVCLRSAASSFPPARLQPRQKRLSQRDQLERAHLSARDRSTRAQAPSGSRFLPEGEAEPALTAQQREDELLDIDDVLGKRIISTRLGRNVTIREENAITALEVMGRFATDPKWPIYLPPAVSLCADPVERGDDAH